MRRMTGFAVCLIAALFALAPIRAGADALWCADYYRAIDYTDTITDGERENIDSHACEFIEKYRLDIVLVAAPEREIGGSPEAFAEATYNDCSFGYGSGRDGVLYLYDPDSGTAEAFLFGGAAEKLTAEALADIEADIPLYFEEYGVWGVMYGAILDTADHLDAAGDYAAERGDGPSPAGMPDWYPENVSSFVFFHDENADRVVDDADLFTDSEEAELRARIAEVIAQTGKDVVVFTDNSTYGLSHAVYAADFYDFNGYGFGPEREGMCLMICMDPADRGWWACATGAETMALYTQENANALDDWLYNDMAAGNYAVGVLEWIDSIGTLYRKGIPAAPDWYPDIGAEVPRIHDADAPRIVDEKGVLTEEERRALEQKAAEISARYGMDVVVNIAGSFYLMSYREYADSFYRYRGYGLGEDDSGILLTVDPGCSSGCRTFCYGSAALTETNEQRLNDHADSRAEQDRYYEACARWLDCVEHMLRTGRVPRQTFLWVLNAVLSALLGVMTAFPALKRAKKKMNTAVVAADADSYVDPETLRIDRVEDTCTGVSEHRAYDPSVESSSRSGGSRGSRGGSSYSSSYSGSSGSSHSGSGRSF